MGRNDKLNWFCAMTAHRSGVGIFDIYSGKAARRQT
jgi:hypothetical protein